ncbi:MAG: hypothetical protein ACI959_001213 [Limisphaerales bacterium]|jgi:hypothetical protein
METFHIIFLDNVGTMNSEGDYNTYEFEEISNIDFDEDFSNLKIDKLIYTADLDMSYGTLKLREISPTFNSINIKSEFTHIQVDLGSNINCELNVKFEMADLKINRASLKVHEYTKNENSGFIASHKFRGTVGSGGDKTIDIDASFGNVDVDID